MQVKVAGLLFSIEPLIFSPAFCTQLLVYYLLDEVLQDWRDIESVGMDEARLLLLYSLLLHESYIYRNKVALMSQLLYLV